MYRRILMQERVVCYSGLDKPGKYEKNGYIPKWSSIRKWPDCDRKRTAVCKESTHNKLKK